jgi:hypothetical protein
MPRIYRLVSVVCLYALSITANATPVAYGLEFQVQYVDTQLDSRLQVGKSYAGFLTVDDSILAADGLNMAGLVSAFRIQMEDVIWDLNFADPENEFHGFRGPEGLGASSPGFDVTSGRLTNLRGGVFGFSDFPFVDFSTDAHASSRRSASACGANSMYCGNAANAFATNNTLGIFGGSMLIHELPEPSAFLLLLVALLSGLAYYGRSRASASDLACTRAT